MRSSILLCSIVTWRVIEVSIAPVCHYRNNVDARSDTRLLCNFMYNILVILVTLNCQYTSKSEEWSNTLFNCQFTPVMKFRAAVNETNVVFIGKNLPRGFCRVEAVLNEIDEITITWVECAWSFNENDKQKTWRNFSSWWKFIIQHKINNNKKQNVQNAR